MQNHEMSRVGLLIVSTLLMIGICFFLLYLVKLIQRRNRELWEVRRKLELEMMKSNIEIQDRALAIISREVHDNVAQVLGMTNMLFMSAVKNRTDEQSLRTLVEESIERISIAIQDLRDVTHSLSTKYIVEIGLEAAIEKEISFVSRLHPIMQFRFSVNEVHFYDDLSEEQTVFLFRIVQECLQNAIKHSEADNVFIQLDYTKGWLGVIIRDNGIGFHSDSRKEGIGLHNMQERMRILGGILKLDSVPGVGTTVSAKIKLLKTND